MESYTRGLLQTVPFGHGEVIYEEAGVSRPWEVSCLTEEMRPEDEAVKSLYGKARGVSSRGGDCRWCALEVFNAAGHARLILLSFERRLRICAWDRWSAGSNTVIEELDARRVGCPAQRLGAV